MSSINIRSTRVVNNLQVFDRDIFLEKQLGFEVVPADQGKVLLKEKKGTRF